MILIVEDNVENAELLRLYLDRKAGFYSSICVNGDEVLRLCRDGQVELVIMDIQLNSTFVAGKSVSGVDLTKTLKADPRTERIPVLLATAHAMRDEREQFLKASGAEGYMTKPVEDFDALIAEIRRWTSRRA